MEATGQTGTVVVVEDDPHIAELVATYLRAADFAALTVATGAEALQAVAAQRPAAVIVDIGLPGGPDGFEVCRRLRADPATTELAIIMLTARGDESDRIAGLEAGADDYVPKPFSPAELVARLRAVLRRSAASPRVLRHRALVVDLDRHEVRRDGEVVEVTTREFDLLAHLVATPGRALTRVQLLDAVWGQGWVGDPRTVDVHVRQLRRKLGDDLALHTVRGHGYRLD